MTEPAVDFAGLTDQEIEITVRVLQTLNQRRTLLSEPKLRGIIENGKILFTPTL
jgi:hypothetical protein